MKDFGYCLSRSTSCGFQKLVVEIKPLGHDNFAGIHFDFQGDKEHPYWYGGDVIVKAELGWTFREAAAIVNRIDKAEVTLPPLDTNDYVDRSLERLLAKFARLKLPRVVYDSRVHEHVPVEKLMGPEFSRWCDDYRRLGNSCVMASVIAENEERAKAILRGQISQHYPESIVKFLEAGQPVFIADAAPAVPTLEELTRLPSAQKG